MSRSEFIQSSGLIIDLFPKSDDLDPHRAALVLRASLCRLETAIALLERTKNEFGTGFDEHFQEEMMALETDCARLSAELEKFPDAAERLELIRSTAVGQSG